jgi:carbonic anhydrase
MKTQTKEIQENLTPKCAHDILLEGNKRFAQNLKAQRNLKDQVFETSKGQFPFAVILSCIDSRAPAELVFDQGIGDVFSVRVAGNIVNEDILGSMEFACKVAGSKIVVVMGHSKCGAVTAACNHVELGNVTSLLNKIQPAVKQVIHNSADVNDDAVEKVAHLNVELSIARIRQESDILSDMEAKGEIEIVGAMYDVATGLVEFI